MIIDPLNPRRHVMISDQSTLVLLSVEPYFSVEFSLESGAVFGISVLR
jgi:hypothetical protein